MTDPKVQALAIRQSVGIERLGEIMYKSGYFTDARSQAQAIVKILAGAELDFGPVASMNGIYIINGRTTMAANLVAAAIQRSGRYRYRVVEHTDQVCTIDFFELVWGAAPNREKLGSSTFTLEQARAAELTNGRGAANWTKFPRNMLWSRAMTNGARWFTPDIFNGPIYTPDELGAEVDDAGNVIEVLEAPADPGDHTPPTRERDVADQPRLVPDQPPPPPRRPMDLVSNEQERVWQRWLQVLAEAQSLGIPDLPHLSLPMERPHLVSAGVKLAGEIQKRRGQLAQEEIERRAGAAKQSAWERNRFLMEQVYLAGKRERELPVSATEAEILSRNAELEKLLEDQPSF
jgi:hypothetical protein